MKLGVVAIFSVWVVTLQGHTSRGQLLPFEVTFQVHLAYDDSLHNAFGRDDSARRYAVAFFNGLNLIFQAMKRPRIKFDIVTFVPKSDQFTKNTLVLDSNEVDAAGSLEKMRAYICKRQSILAADIIFVMSRRKVFSRGHNGKKSYSPQGLTYEAGICINYKKMVIVHDDGKYFSGLTNAAFQLSRLLGAPTSCSPDHYRLFGQFVPFSLNDCATSNITKNIRKLSADDRRECFSRKFFSSVSQDFGDVLPVSVIGDFCLNSPVAEAKRHVECTMIKVKHAAKVDGPTPESCTFSCCNEGEGNEYIEYSSFEGEPCGYNKEGRCAGGKCVRVEFVYPDY